MTWRGVFTGILALVALETVVRTNESAGRFGALLEGAGAITRRVMSPAVAAIPETRTLLQTNPPRQLDSSPYNPFD